MRDMTRNTRHRPYHLQRGYSALTRVIWINGLCAPSPSCGSSTVLHRSLLRGLGLRQMEQVTRMAHPQILPQPSLEDLTRPKGDVGSLLVSTQTCGQAGGALEDSMVAFLLVLAGVVLLILLCAALLLCYRHWLAHSSSIQYINLYSSARYTLKEPCPSPKQRAPRPSSLPPTLPLPPPPPPPSPPPPTCPTALPLFQPNNQPPSFHPTPPNIHLPATPLLSAPPFVHTTPPSPLLTAPDMVVYSRIGLVRTSRPPSATGTHVILFEHSSL
ncbi:hypothetical protein GJAV_G00042910 [Gymnothorax javanicus]|nr:hypothetical protein GJAV_G00042910 [Gymnothorax javanicus]